MKSFACALALVIALVAVAFAEQPECTGNRHYDDEGQCCPVTTTTVVSETTTTTTLEGDEGDGDDSCPEPPPCQTVKCECTTDVCVNAACTNGSVGTDGAGACSKDTDCINGTVNNTTTVNNITVNRCPSQEALIPCHRRKSGRVVCPSTLLPQRELVPYSTAQKLGNPRHKGKAFKLPPVGPTP